MTEQITITIDGTPVGKARARVLRSGGAYTPAKSVNYETAIGWAARDAMRGRQPFVGGVTVTAAFDMPIPVSWSKRKQAMAITGQLTPGRPDLDNMMKAVLDALNGVAFQDDASVLSITARKRFSTSPKTICTVSPTNPEGGDQ